MLHVIHCIQSGCILPGCMESTAFNHAAWNPLNSIGMHFTRLPWIHAFIPLHGLYCIQQDPLRDNAWNTLHSMTLPAIHCIQSGCILPGCMESTAFNPTAWNPLHSIGMHFTRLHGIHCIQSCCMNTTAFNHAAWNPLHSIGMLLAMLHKIHSIQLFCRTPMHSIMLHKLPRIQ